MCTLSLVTALSGNTENYLLFTKTHLNIEVFISCGVWCYPVYVCFTCVWGAYFCVLNAPDF